MYDLHDHLKMMRDRVRCAAHESAIRAVVRPGDTVLDLGCGAGVMTFVALEAGAGHVHAVESSEVIEVARHVARANGCESRVTFLRGDSTSLELPARVDVLMADVRGALPPLRNGIALLADARRRFLKPGGRQVPLRDTIFVAPVECAGRRELVEAWRGRWGAAEFGCVAEVAANRWNRWPLSAGDLLAPGQPLPPLDYERGVPSSVARTMRFTITRDGGGTCDGLGAWFEAELAPGISFSTAPGLPATVYGQAFFPWARGHAVNAGDTLDVDFGMHLLGDSPVFRWSLVTGGGTERHSSFEGSVPSRESLSRRSERFIPRLDEQAEITRCILDHMDGRRTLGEIAGLVAARFPHRFGRARDALRDVSELSDRHARAGESG